MPITQVANILPETLLDGDSTPQQETRALASAVVDAHGATYDVTITSAQLLALFATPITVLDAPDAGFAWLIDRVVAYKSAGTAYGGIAAGEDLTLKYTNASGAICAQLETTGFLDQTTAQTRAVRGTSTDLTPVAAAAIVAHMLVVEITTGDSPLKLRITARLIPVAF